MPISEFALSALHSSDESDEEDDGEDYDDGNGLHVGGPSTAVEGGDLDHAACGQASED